MSCRFARKLASDSNAVRTWQAPLVVIHAVRITVTEVVAHDSLHPTCVRSRHRRVATASAAGLTPALARLSEPGLCANGQHRSQRAMTREDYRNGRTARSRSPEAVVTNCAAACRPPLRAMKPSTVTRSPGLRRSVDQPNRSVNTLGAPISKLHSVATPASSFEATRRST